MEKIKEILKPIKKIKDKVEEKIKEKTTSNSTEPTLVKHFTKFVYPFRFTKNDKASRLNEAITSGKGTEMKLFLSTGIDGSELRGGVSEYYSDKEDECSSRIAKCYRLNDQCRRHFNLPQRAIDFLIFTARGDNAQYKIQLTDVRIFLFETGVGFLEVECVYPEGSTINDYLECNYFISETKGTKADVNVFSHTRKLDKDTEEVMEFKLKDLLLNVLSYVGDVRHFEGDSTQFSDKNTVIYSYALLTKEPKTLPYDLAATLFLARKNFKGSYKFPQREYDIASNRNIFQSFGNSYWATSQCGTINLSHLTDDETTNDFFKTLFPSKLRNAYYHLFLSVLHQKYAMYILSRIECLEKIEKNYEASKKQLKEVRENQEKAALLKMRAFFKNPSNHEHINKYFELLNVTYEIEEIYKDFCDSIQSAETICDTHVAKIESYENKIAALKKEKISVILTVFTPVVAFITVFRILWEVLESFWSEQLTFADPQIFIMAIVLAFPVMLILLGLVRRMKEIRKLKREIQEMCKIEGEEKVRGKK
ncbi:MAG: hypothetical protein FWE22_04205 [Firmicutes bacterium]|nr:hypothetical protein [Bacillota bacterium]